MTQFRLFIDELVRMVDAYIPLKQTHSIKAPAMRNIPHCPQQQRMRNEQRAQGVNYNGHGDA